MEWQESDRAKYRHRNNFAGPTGPADSGRVTRDLYKGASAFVAIASYVLPTIQTERFPFGKNIHAARS